MIEACPIHVWDICVFANSSYCRILIQDFWLMQMDLFSHNEKKFCVTRIKLQLRPCHPGRHGHTQCCNFSIDSIALETDRDTFEHHWHKDDGSGGSTGGGGELWRLQTPLAGPDTPKCACEHLQIQNFRGEGAQTPATPLSFKPGSAPGWFMSKLAIIALSGL